jgi:2-phospho-L-lactate/phosphoenolpyruvate guanylyltransferase
MGPVGTGHLHCDAMSRLADPHEPGGPGEPPGRPPAGDADPRSTAVLIPVKAFRHAKLRLAPALDQPARAALARTMATQVVRAARSLPVAVVCDDSDVAHWARELGARVIWSPGRGLNGAVTDGVAALAESDVTVAIVAHADLPHALDLTWLAGRPPVTVVPDRRGDGTNVITVPTTAGFTFSYGAGSFGRHRIEAARLGLEVHVCPEPRLGWDVDVPDDLATPDWTLAG